MKILSSLAKALLVLPLAACSGSQSSTPDSGLIALGDSSSPKHDARDHDAASDAGKGDAADNGAISTTYPAFTVDMPRIVSNQGVVLKSPVIVTITWPGQDSSFATWEAMGDAMGGSSYWSKTTAEYGVGAAVSGSTNHVHMVRPLPSSLNYYQLAAVVSEALGVPVDGGAPDAGAHDAGAPDGGAHEAGAGDAEIGDGGVNPAWPAPTMLGGNVQTIYSLFIPMSVSVTDPGSGAPFCTEGGLGYHDNIVLGSSTPVAYSVTMECSGQTIPDLEETVAHEYVEAATNPYPSTTNLGYVGFDPDHLAWDIYTGFNDELADACQNWAASYYEESPSSPYWVQRIWSNANAAKGYDPCAPRANIPYVGMTLFPAAESMITVDLTSVGLSSMPTRGFSAKVGDTLQFQVGFYSDSSTGGPWTIAYDFPTVLQLGMSAPVTNGAATVTMDLTSGQNGQKANVTFTPTTAGPLGFQIMAITWDPPVGAAAMLYQPHYLPIIISNN